MLRRLTTDQEIPSSNLGQDCFFTGGLPGPGLLQTAWEWYLFFDINEWFMLSYCGIPGRIALPFVSSSRMSPFILLLVFMNINILFHYISWKWRPVEKSSHAFQLADPTLPYDETIEDTHLQSMIISNSIIKIRTSEWSHLKPKVKRIKILNGDMLEKSMRKVWF